MPDQVAQQFREAAEDGFLPPLTEKVFAEEIRDDEIRRRLVSELTPLPMAVYEEPIPLADGWLDAPCAYLRLSHRYPQALARAEQDHWTIHRFDGDHFYILVDPDAVASALSDIGRATD